MRRHIFAWLGVAVIAMVVGTWSLSSAAQPGEEVPDSIADSLRGGADCFQTTSTAACINLSTKVYCDDGNTLQCKAGTVKSFTGVGNNWKPKGANYCCGSGTATCSQVTPDRQACGTAVIVVGVP